MANLFHSLIIKLDSEDSSWRLTEGLVNVPVVLPPASYVFWEPLACVGCQLTGD